MALRLSIAWRTEIGGLKYISDQEVLRSIWTCNLVCRATVTWSILAWYQSYLMNRKFNIRSVLVKCSFCDMVTKCGFDCIYTRLQTLCDIGFGLVLLILLSWSGIELVYCWIKLRDYVEYCWYVEGHPTKGLFYYARFTSSHFQSASKKTGSALRVMGPKTKQKMKSSI